VTAASIGSTFDGARGAEIVEEGEEVVVAADGGFQCEEGEKQPVAAAALACGVGALHLPRDASAAGWSLCRAPFVWRASRGPPGLRLPQKGPPS